jgi:hypothetical protein
MSLINDALKRAREMQQKNPPSGAPPLPPVESPARRGTVWILAAAAILFLAAACLFIGSSLFGHKASPAETAKVPEVSTLPSAPALTAAAPVSVVATAPVSIPPPVATPATNALPQPSAHTNPAAAAGAAAQLPKVQGIIFNAARPVAIVNGKAVNVGDRVGEFQVKQILKGSVLFQRPDGSQKTLEIGD